MVRKGALCVCVIVFSFVAGGAGAGEGPTGPGVDRLTESLPKSLSVKAAPLYPMMDSGLNRVLAERSPLEKAGDLGFKTRNERIQVVLVTSEGATREIADWITENGATNVLSAGNLVEAFVPVDLLEAFHAEKRILYVRKPAYFMPEPKPERSLISKAGTYQTEGLAAINANSWHSAGLSGDGVKVAIIDIGFKGYTALLGSDLPAGSRVFFADFMGSGMENDAHGTACAEIVHDIVPDAAEMHLYVAGSSVQVSEAIDTARIQGIDVISISLGTLVWGPGDGTGVIADAINSFTSAGGVVATSAGNFRVGHWQGAWSDANSNGYLDFSSDVEVNYLTSDGDSIFNLPADEDISVQLVWNQWSAPATDLDLYLYQWNSDTEEWEEIESSEDTQTGGAGQQPIEFLSFTTTEAGYYGAVVKHYSGPTAIDVELTVRPETLPLRVNVANGSVSVPGDTPSAISVAAVDTDSPYPLEFYSSRGPTNGPGGSLSGGFVTPDISGYANVSTTAYGTRGFNGTSAACPHVAGAAALVWSAKPSWTNLQVRSFLESNAVDKGPNGKDNDYGYGRLYLGSPPVSCSYSLSPTSRTLGSSGGSGSFSVSTQSGCSWNATTSKAWIHVTGGSNGSGNGTVSYSVDANSSSSQRSGTIQAAGKSFSITQSGAASCSYSISPGSRSHGASGGTGTVNVSSSAGCSWSAASNKSWITVTGGSSGSGNGTVSYGVGNNSSSSSRSGAITIGGKTFTVSQAGSGGGSSSSGDHTYFAVVAHTTGANNSVWKSSLSMCNVSSSDAPATLTYRYGSKSVVRNVVIAPYGLAEWTDAPVDLFGVGGKSSGVVSIESDARLLVAVRTFNSSVDGTFGQSLPGVSSSVSMTSLQFGIISPVKRTSQFRTNIGVINTGSKSCTVEIVFGDTRGFIIGNPISMNLAAGEWKQTNEALKKAGISRAEAAIALVQVKTAGAEVWAYGTVIDNSSGDPTALGMAIFE